MEPARLCVFCHRPSTEMPGDLYECLGDRGNALLLWICDGCAARHSPPQGGENPDGAEDGPG